MTDVFGPSRHDAVVVAVQGLNAPFMGSERFPDEDDAESRPKGMGQMKRRIVVALTAALAIVPGAAGASQTPTPIEFVVPSGTGLTGGTTGDNIHVFGRSSGSVPVGDCASGEHPRQSAMAIDPQGGRPSKIHEIITTSQTEPVRNGTRITDLVSQGPCFNNQYDKYRGLAK